MSPSSILVLVFVFVYILLGTLLVTLLFNAIGLGMSMFLATKTGSQVSSTAERVYDFFLYYLSVSLPYSAPPASSSDSSRGYLEGLPQRSGVRPTISGVSNPRQTTQLVSTEKNIVDRLRGIIAAVKDKYPESTYLGRSTFEGGNITLFARRRAFDKTRYYGEILKVDNKEGMMITVLHPIDVQTVVEKGWGQRHPLSSRRATWFRYLSAPRGLVAKAGTEVILYAPRNQEDLNVIAQVVNAAIWCLIGDDSTSKVETCC